MIDNSIHQIWVGNKRMPSLVKDYTSQVKKHHNNFNYCFWSDVVFPELPERIKRIYDSYEKPVMKADLLRMYVVYKYGGTYLDADLIPIKGMYSDVISNDYDGFIIYDDSYQMSALSNTMFGFKKNSPLLEYMLDNVVNEGQWTGPNWWAQTICKYLQLDINETTVHDLKEKLSHMNIQVVHWKDVETNCFRHEALASWIEGSVWYDKLKNEDYD
jgi:mannosyltransferase OCH1-like enzyme